MSQKILHILNGDATLEKFNQTNIKGDCAIWRETLALGPLFYQVDSELFWEMRSQFMEKAYGANLGEYKREVIGEFRKLRASKHDEIVLWYEYDLFCQVNFIALMSYILKAKKKVKVSLVCVGDYPGKDKRVGLGEIPSSDYIGLYENRIVVGKEELLKADRVWMLWCGKEVGKFRSADTEGLPYLSDALEAAKVLFSEDGGLSELELGLRSMLQSGDHTTREIIRECLLRDKTLGFGDLQYEYILSQLA